LKRILLFLFVITLSLWLTLSVFAYGVEQSVDDDHEYYYDDYYYDEDHESEEESSFDVGSNLLIALVAGLVISLIITGVMRSQMKSVRAERAARNYIRHNSMNILRSHDLYLYSHVTKRPKPQNNNKR